MEKKTHTEGRDSYHHGDLRAQLIEATRMLVEQKGPDHFSVSEACRVAGVSTAAPYKHFKSKEEMLKAVTLDGMLRHRQQMLDELEKHEIGVLDRIVGLGRVYVSFAQAEPGVFRLMFALSESHAEDEELVQTGDDTFALVQLEVARCKGREVIDADDIHRAFLLWSFVHGLSFLLIDGKLANKDVPFDLEFFLEDIARRVVGQD